MLNMISRWLLVIGGLNWGLVGIGYFANINLNLVTMIFGKVPVLEAVVYILVGAAAVHAVVNMNK